MKKKCTKLLALVLAAVLLMGAMPITAMAAAETMSGTFKFAPHTVWGRDLEDSYVYSDDYFAQSAYQANIELAIISMALAAASISSQDAEIADQYEQKNRNIIDLLEKLGFEDIESEYFKPQTDTMAVTIAHKQITVRTTPYTLMVVVPRSAGYEREWSGNFNVTGGEDLQHNGFRMAVDVIREKVMDYTAEYGETFEGEMKLWTMGYSRGAAVANLFGGLLHAQKNFIPGLALKPENTYVYTFGTPKNIMSCSVYRPKDVYYGYIHNYYSEYDPITMMPLEQWGYTRFGSDHLLPTANSSKKEKMLILLKRINPEIYEIYVSEQDPDMFQTIVLSLAQAGIDLLERGATEQEQASMKEFLDGRMQIMATIAPDAAAYGGTYQNMLCSFMELYHGMSLQESAAFMGHFTETERLKAGVMALEMFAAQYISGYSKETLLGVVTLGDIPMLVELVLAFDDNLDEQTKAAIMQTINALITDEVKDYTAQDAVDYLNALAAENLAALMSGAMEAAKAADAKSLITDELIAKVLGADNENMAAMVEFFGAILFQVDRSQIELPEEDSEDASAEELLTRPVYQQLALDMAGTAATLLKNSGMYLRVHNNEVLISWLRAYAQSEEIAVQQSGGGNHTVEAPVWNPQKEQEEDALHSFRDLEQQWYRDGIRYCVEHDLMNGVSETAFMPDGAMTRAMAVTVLWRMEGEPAAKEEAGFADVLPGTWYAEAVAWAKEEGIVNGMTEEEFAPNGTLSRQQLAAMLWRYAGEPSVSYDLSAFADEGQTADYAREAMAWAVKNQVINGMDQLLQAQANATRAQFAEMVRRYQEG